MRNIVFSSNALIARLVEALQVRLPDGWTVTKPLQQPSFAGYRPDAILEVKAPDGSKAVVVVEAKARITAAEAALLGPRIGAAVKAAGASGGLLVASFLSPLTRDRLRAAGLSYVDLTGNARVTLERPGLLIDTQGADRDPSPRGRGLRSLKGGAAARIVRALADWRPPVGVRELARRAHTDPGHATRILTLLETEDVVRRDESGEVTDVKLHDLLRRWAQDYAVSGTNRVIPYLAPRGIDAFLRRLLNYSNRFALTGSLAVPRSASMAATRAASCYVESPEQAAKELDLRQVEAGSNILLLEPFDEVIWERTREEDGLTRVALTQCAVDLLSGTGREPAEADALLAWMTKNEGAWRA